MEQFQVIAAAGRELGAVAGVVEQVLEARDRGAAGAGRRDMGQRRVMQQQDQK